MPVSKDFTSVYSHQWAVNFIQCAPNGYLKYVDLCNLLQLTAAEHSVAGGLSYADMQVFDQAWVLTRIRIEIIELPRWQDVVTVTTWIESLQSSGSVRNMEMYLDGRKIAGSSTHWAVFNTKLRKSEALALPHSHFEKYPDRHAISKSLSRLNMLRDTSHVGSHCVVLSDLDIVNHVNNTKYLEWCLDYTDTKKVLQRKISGIEMNYIRELNLGDCVDIHNANGQMSDFYSVVKGGKVCFGLLLEFLVTV